MTSPNFHSTLIGRPTSNKSLAGMAVDSQINPFTSLTVMSQLNLHNVSSFDETVVSVQTAYDNTTLKDLETQETVIEGTQVSYHEESESPTPPPPNPPKKKHA